MRAHGDDPGTPQRQAQRRMLRKHIGNRAGRRINDTGIRIEWPEFSVTGCCVYSTERYGV